MRPSVNATRASGRRERKLCTIPQFEGQAVLFVVVRKTDYLPFASGSRLLAALFDIGRGRL